jgi:hypothetical protein
VPVIADTAYPRLTSHPTALEMESFTPTPDELSFVEQCTRVPGSRLALLILLKTFQRLGYFVQLADVPAVIGAHIAGAAEMADGAEEFAVYDGTTYRTRLMKLVREFAGVMAYDRTARSIAVRASMEASRTRDDVVDIVNVAIEELIRHRYELPTGCCGNIASRERAF